MILKKEVVWLFSSSSLNALYVLICYAILTQIESPQAIGELAIINIVLSFAFLIQDVGLSGYLIHRQKITTEQQTALFYISVLFGLICVLLLLLVSYPIGYLYGAEKITHGIIIVSANFLIIGFSNQYQAQYIKHLKNIELAKIEIIAKVISLLFTAFFMLEMGLGMFGYLLGVVISSLIKLVLLVTGSDRSWHPHLHADWSIVKPALVFGSYQIGSHIVNQLRTQADQLIIGAALSVESLGVYSLAKEMVMQPIKLTMPVFTRLVLPRFAALQSNMSNLLEFYEKTANYIVVANTVVYGVCIALVWLVLPHFLNAEYAIVPALFIFLVLVGLLRPLGGLFGVISQALGKSQIEFKWNVIAGSVSILGMCIAYFYDSIWAFVIVLPFLQVIFTSYAIIFFSSHLTKFNRTKHFMRIFFNLLIYAILIFMFFVFE
ncbi:oligosaccharide flippase family protein [Paraglaciecola aquimarina]|uniref:Oligosaccharide flippase family protein n=1 Tax=Paraglaciecola algarum TaxID=3050085 RepID=A0ABS9D645_9ALTE|nr:oligosaccharide flippase family protein [Paraglaciecola sp. G1-23]MCF2948432.1 oligosaccharide flippase family protein [Paraglaciecola sp. G1-23]